MNTKSIFKYRPGAARMLAVLAIAGLLGTTSCSKNGGDGQSSVTSTREVSSAAAAASTTTGGKATVQRTLTSVVTVAGIRPLGSSSAIRVMFNENAQFLNVTDAAAIAAIKDAFSTGKALQITFDPWQAIVVKAGSPSAADAVAVNNRARINGASGAHAIDFKTMTDDVVNEPSAMGILNTTDPGLNNLVPDFATAQMMFDYIAHQCCALPGPYAVDHCITFQYCPDGCYARAHKMCWIINNRYKYGTKKIFSFANAGSDELCVQAQKWGGCCINWWYHVAPLVTVQTPTGPKAYVFDPAMFNQPVLLATWLHAQENPACAGGYTPHVTMINVQPTTAYTPAGGSGLTFSTDPAYSSTNSTLISYRYLVTCP